MDGHGLLGVGLDGAEVDVGVMLLVLVASRLLVLLERVAAVVCR